jgi:hypothetical protein
VVEEKRHNTAVACDMQQKLVDDPWYTAEAEVGELLFAPRFGHVLHEPMYARTITLAFYRNDRLISSLEMTTILSFPLFLDSSTLLNAKKRPQKVFKKLIHQH